MYYYRTMHATFEAEKNKKALTYTAIICGTLLLLLLLIRWQIIPPPIPLAQDLIEINLGNNDDGFGQEQPLVKGDMGSAVTQPQPTAASQAENMQPDENDDADAAPISKPEKIISKTNTIVTQPTKNKAVATIPTPAVPKPRTPKILFPGQKNGTGNGANQDNGFHSQGNTPGGKGDNGSPTGKPDSYGNSPGGKTGVSVTRGVMPLNMGQLRFEDDFNENAKLYLDVRYNSSGNFTSCAVGKGTTSSNPTIIGIAKRKAANLKFPPSDNGGVSTILFNFRVN